ncbi:hypothetical protein A2631_02750 [Candidatus Daviesbacteria bacterium RIFCSPHIGHO2_01_FULL_44_29]|uniref:Glycosyltransferase 2-like domain-containing protein n=1 Tax=Candidatus Daviesbacteria bacterium RIFCSPHIGHO2_02_FULL_43_12 TaxID=1797776 RepID=A0A1F5KK49_9BACT|nr:MAG: hypothetical protein A2631_02750 [Candidatus Daviesbacteria bacterium RIFCSPHIGHO2_01_FULL_44_29]OGE41303.1 MAG: hypothetical protein A3D25_02145 [Candidatus Daviesbacteria bacterium RIFCSPHIGHO2_02_FULL_43_12]OGE69504.1 MAG: hypothetical protein A3B55_03885 [Candidatus Daviesbacteria bacterium RIFCSPLOWO2_01_FULL_43_15]
MKISVVYVVFNETEKLRKSLQSISNFAEEIVIIDIGSEPRVQDLSKEFRAKYQAHAFVPFVELIRDYSIAQTSGDWILIMDPDEELSESLKVKLREFAASNEYSVINIPRKNIFAGQWISHTNFWPDRQIRFFRRGAVSWPRIIHTYPKIEGEAYNLPAIESNALLHFGYDNFSQFLSRQRRYAKIEAQNLSTKGIRFSPLRLIWQPTREFLVRFIKHRGYLDGWWGIGLVLGLMYYRILVELHLYSLSEQK